MNLATRTAATLATLATAAITHAQAEDCPGSPPITPAAASVYITDDTTVRAPSGAPDCSGATSAIGDTWFQVRGTGRRITITTCPGVDPLAFTQYNNVITVYCADCTDFTCVAESTHSCTVQPQAATVRWCSNAGERYFVRVHGDGGAPEGQFNAAIFDSGPCSTPVDCSSTTEPPAKHVVTFDNEPLGTSYGAVPPGTTVLIEDSIEVRSDFFACSGFYGDAIITNIPPVAGFGSGRFPEYFAFGLEFDFTTLPGTVDHVTFEFAHRGNQCGLEIDGTGILCNQAYRFIPHPQLTVTDAPFGLGVNDFWGTARIDGNVQKLRIFGDELHIDNVCAVLTSTATTGCISDIDGDGTTTIHDLLIFLTAWFAGDSAADINNDGTTDVADLLELLAVWFPASNGLPCP